MKKTIAQNMFEIMKQNNITLIWYGDIDIIEKCAKQSGVLKKHPQNTINTILNALDKSSLFTKSYITSDFNGYIRKYRAFSIKD